MSWGIEGTNAQVSVGAQPGTLPLGLSEELLGFLKMKGMLEQPLQGGVSAASIWDGVKYTAPSLGFPPSSGCPQQLQVWGR